MMNLILIAVSLCLYGVLIKIIGIPMARLAWKIWDENDVNHKLAFLFFPVYKTFDKIGIDYFGLAHPFVPIVGCHGRYSGNGFGVLNADPIWKSVYITYAGVFWLLVITWNIIEIIIIKTMEWLIIMPCKFSANRTRAWFLRLTNYFDAKDKKEQAKRRVSLLPKEFNESQIKCVSNAKWHYKEIKTSLEKTGEISDERLESCFWFIVFAHFRGFTDTHSGYTLDLSMPRIIKRTRTAVEPVLLPKLKEIICCNDREKKSLLAYQYVFILMAAVFDPSGGRVCHEVLREVLEADDFAFKGFEEKNRGKFLEPLGFKPHHFGQGSEAGVTWYWPIK
jgi:hypothetical protein